MRPKEFEIVLACREGVYFSGQTLQGHVILELEKDKKVRGIRMKIRGKAFVHWTEQPMRGPGESRFKEIRHHSATEEYIDVSQPLLPRASTTGIEEGHVLKADRYLYPFTFCIPATSPSSFEGQYGFIRYWVKVTIERPWKEDTSVKKFFSVLCPVDLNREPSAAHPTHQKRAKSLCCLCCTSGPIEADLSLSHKGFVPGETLYINAEINNNSRRKIENTTVELLMTTTYRTVTKTRSLTKQVARLHHDSLMPGTTDFWEGDHLVLPSLPPSYAIGCGIIDIKYILELRVFPVGPAFELTVPVEILIGTVPLHSTLERYFSVHQMTPPTPRGMGARGGASAVNDIDCNPPPHYLPPTFSPSPVCQVRVHDDEDDQRMVLNTSYTPLYTNFNFQQVQPRRHHTVRFAT